MPEQRHLRPLLGLGLLDRTHLSLVLEHVPATEARAAPLLAPFSPRGSSGFLTALMGRLQEAAGGSRHRGMVRPRR